MIIFEELSDPNFVPPAAVDSAKTDKERIKLLDEYNTKGETINRNSV